MVQILVVRVDIGVVTYEAISTQCGGGGGSVVEVLVVRVHIGVVTYEVLTYQCGRSVVQVLFDKVDTGVVIRECMIALSVEVRGTYTWLNIGIHHYSSLLHIKK